MADRWFLVPITGTGTTDDPYEPKYAATSGVSGWAGHIVTVSGSDYFAVRYHGTTSSLDSIESNSDATSIQEAGLSKQDVADYLNNETGHAYSFSEWENRFFTQ